MQPLKRQTLRNIGMKVKIFIIAGLLASFGLGFFMSSVASKKSETTTRSSNLNQIKEKGDTMKLGAFSVSLSVKDIRISKAFYEKLGFSAFAGSLEQNYLIMKNENSLIGLFEGMFEGNILTFNPGWDENAQNIDNFDDVREIQKHLKIKDVKLADEADENTSGPASLMLTDPDGNMILIDQHR
jgi:catechol 2,3-dioxygenase-like lactoylglutathione lyase family enzyme